MQAAKKGHDAYFGHKSNLFSVIPKLQKGIFIHKSIQVKKFDQINRLKNLGHLNCSIDEEGLMIQNEEEYLNYRCTKKCLDAVDVFFAWGEKHKSVILKKYPYLENKIICTGNSRIDILKYKDSYEKQVKELKSKYGQFLLFVTKFGRFNYKKRGMGTWAEMAKRSNPQITKENYEKILQSEIYEKENMFNMMDAIRIISKLKPHQNIIIRPHPSEEISTWEKFAKSIETNNVMVIFDANSINPWLLAAKNVISHNCTTSLESAILGKISINYLLPKKSEFEYEVPLACSLAVRDKDKLIDILNSEKS